MNLKESNAVDALRLQAVPQKRGGEFGELICLVCLQVLMEGISDKEKIANIEDGFPCYVCHYDIFTSFALHRTCKVESWPPASIARAIL